MPGMQNTVPDVSIIHPRICPQCESSWNQGYSEEDTRQSFSFELQGLEDAGSSQLIFYTFVTGTTLRKNHFLDQYFCLLKIAKKNVNDLETIRLFSQNVSISSIGNLF